MDNYRTGYDNFIQTTAMVALVTTFAILYRNNNVESIKKDYDNNLKPNIVAILVKDEEEIFKNHNNSNKRDKKYY